MASDSALFIRWDRPATGREASALELFNGFTNYLAKQQQVGNLDSFEPVLLPATGSYLGGCMLIRGSRSSLNKLRESEEFLAQVAQADFTMKGFGVTDAWVGEGVRTQMARYEKVVRATR